MSAFLFWVVMPAFTINVRSNVVLVASNFRDLGQRQIPFATALALTRTAQAVKRAEIAEMQRVFDRPTPYTLNALYVKPATKANLSAHVWLKDDTSKGTPAEKYLGAQIEGGGRRLKRFERALRAKGFLPEGMVAVPSSAVQLDSYGNMKSSQIVQILSALRAFGEQGYLANRTKVSAARKRKGKKQSQYFVSRPGGGRLPLGVWMRSTSDLGRSGGRIRPVLLFVKAPQYKARFKFHEIAEHTVATEFPKELKSAFEFAMATAR